MDVIRDAKGRVVCKGDPVLGIIESRYCKFSVKTGLNHGESMSIEREGSITLIYRTHDNRFIVKYIS